jgi:hypothetical protein
MPYADAPRTTVGTLGSGYDMLAQDLMENVPALTFPLSMQVYSRMRTDPHIAGVLAAYDLPLRSATYAINPRGCRDEVVQFCADAWGLPIAGDNDGPGPARRRGVEWDDHLRLALLMLPFGFSPFAIRYEIGGDPLRARLAELSERLPQTITDIEVDDDGALKGMRQYNEKKLMPANSLLRYTHRREGSAYQGRSMLRESYAPWLLKHEMWRAISQSGRRFTMGVPNVETGPNPTPADVSKAAEIASAFRSGDLAGLGLPQGWKFNLTGLTGTVPDTLGFVNYLDAQMATSVLAEILNLDSASTGNRALGDTVIGLLQMSWKAVAREITGPATKLNIQMVDYNFGEDEPVPAVLCTDINRPEITSEAISSLVTCGALTPDLTLENDLRTRYDLPVISERPAAPQQTPPTPDAGTAPVTSPGVGGRTNEPAAA